MKLASLPLLCATICCLNLSAPAADYDLWEGYFEMGGSLPSDPGLAGGGEMDIDPGFTMNLGLNHRITEWMKVGPSVGFEFNFIDSFGGVDPISDAELFQMPMLVNLTFEPPQPWVVKPFVSVGAGGNLGILTSRYWYDRDWYYGYTDFDSDHDLSLAWQVSTGARWQVGENWSLSLVYRFLNSEGQSWTFRDFFLWYDSEFDVSVDRLQIHLFAFQISRTF